MRLSIKQLPTVNEMRLPNIHSSSQRLHLHEYDESNLSQIIYMILGLTFRRNPLLPDPHLNGDVSVNIIVSPSWATTHQLSQIELERKNPVEFKSEVI